MMTFDHHTIATIFATMLAFAITIVWQSKLSVEELKDVWQYIILCGISMGININQVIFKNPEATQTAPIASTTIKPISSLEIVEPKTDASSACFNNPNLGKQCTTDNQVPGKYVCTPSGEDIYCQAKLATTQKTHPRENHGEYFDYVHFLLK